MPDRVASHSHDDDASPWRAAMAVANYYCPVVICDGVPAALHPACLKGAFAKGCFLAFDVLRGKHPLSCQGF